jgi:MoaA/NifB/PqqE/SkfB family radical SAM enzyme
MKNIGKLENIGRRLAYLSPSGKNQLGPRWIVLVVNNICNLHCKMCDVGTGASDTIFYRNLIGQGYGNMTLDLFDRILGDAGEFPLRPRLSFSYTEPGIHPQVLEMIERAKRAGFYCSLTTNGFTLPRLAEPLVELGLDELFVSVDGTREVHNEVRGSTRSYDLLMQGMRKVAEIKTQQRQNQPTLNVVYVFTEQSYLTLVELLEELRPVRPAQVVATLLNFIHPQSAELHNRRFGQRYPATVTNLHKVNLRAFDYDALLLQIDAARARAAELGISLNLRPNMKSKRALQSYFENVNEPVAGNFCSDPWNMVMIQTNGEVIPAHGRCFNTIAGNLHDDSLRAIWNNQVMMDFRRLLKIEGGVLPACTRCCGCFDHQAGKAEKAAFALQKVFLPSFRQSIEN